jgi:lysophospholipid acyltransferase (LPLAT)-like uncharacterized protein
MSALRFWLAGTIGRRLIDALMATIRFHADHADRYESLAAEGQPVIFAVWHGRLLPLTYYHRHRNITAIISQSKDGEYIARVVEGWGYRTVRGSTSRGGSGALRSLVKAARAGESLAITPDGPRGPRQQLQPGVITAAQLTGLPIVPLACGASRAWWPGGWDRFCVPKPFARVRVMYGTPRWVARDADEEDLDRHARELEEELNEMIREADGDGGPRR